MTFYIFFNFIIIFKAFSSSPLCINNTNNCILCNNSTNLCEKCKIPQIFIPDEEGGCKGAKKCIEGRNYCKECDKNGKFCLKCEENLFPDENGACSYTIGCQISFLGQCHICKDDYYLVGTYIRICKSRFLEEYNNCLEVNGITGYCMICEKGYELQLGDHKCTKLQHCNESIYGNCISCDPCYYYNKKEEKCLMIELEISYCKISLDGINCEICNEGYFLDEKGICMESPFCSESFYFKCIKCLPGYYLSTFNICTTTENCYSVDKTSFLCISCQKNYYLNKKDYKCYSNLDYYSPFIYCTIVENEICTLCDYGYYLTEDFKCANTKNCAEAENGKCLKCSKSYYLGLDNMCTNIEKCIYSENGKCIECEDGYYCDTFNNTCLEMENIFLNCKYTCALGDICCECKNGFYMDLNDSLCYNNTIEESFIKCAYVDYNYENDNENGQKYCKFCETGYYLGMDDNKCCKVDNCKIVENENKCFECDKFYCLDIKKNECIFNAYLDDINDKKYINCNRTNEDGTKCEICINGYELNEEGFCVDSDFCEEQKDGKCLKCKDLIINYYSLCLNDIFGCITSFQDNCLRCDDLEDLGECTECKEGYVKKDYMCEKIVEN